MSIFGNTRNVGAGDLVNPTGNTTYDPTYDPSSSPDLTGGAQATSADITDALIDPAFAIQNLFSPGGSIGLQQQQTPGFTPDIAGAQAPSGRSTPQQNINQRAPELTGQDALDALMRAIKLRPTDRGMRTTGPSWFAQDQALPFSQDRSVGTEQPSPSDALRRGYQQDAGAQLAEEMAETGQPQNQASDRGIHVDQGQSGDQDLPQYGKSPAGQVQSRFQQPPPAPIPRPRPIEAPAQPPATAPPAPDVDTPRTVRTERIPGSAPAGDRTFTPPATTAPPVGAPGAPGTQRPQNLVQALFQALGISPTMATSLSHMARQVGSFYGPPGYGPGGRYFPEREPLPNLPQQTPPSGLREEVAAGGAGAGGAAAGTPGEAENYIMQHGGHTAGTGAPNLNPEFASRIEAAARAYQQETGDTPRFGEMGRSHEKQREYREEMLRTGRGLAAPEYTSRHEIESGAEATDIPNGRFQDWMHRNASRFGLQGLRDPRDPNHFQLDRKYSGPKFAGRTPADSTTTSSPGGTMNRRAYEGMFSGTPLANQYDNIMKAAYDNNVPPALMASIIAEETGRGQSPQVRTLLNPAGIFSNGRYKQYRSIEEGIADSGRVIGNIYRRAGNSIQGMARVYAPPHASNDPNKTNAQWPGAVQQLQNRLQAEQQQAMGQ